MRPVLRNQDGALHQAMFRLDEVAATRLITPVPLVEIGVQPPAPPVPRLVSDHLLLGRARETLQRLQQDSSLDMQLSLLTTLLHSVKQVVEQEALKEIVESRATPRSMLHDSTGVLELFTCYAKPGITKR